MTYYTPTQDEFYSGFEMIRIDGDNNITKHIFNNDQIMPLPEQIKVKYIDIEDLIELGFKIKTTKDDKTILFKNVVNNEKPEFYILEFQTQNNMPFITLSDMFNQVMIAELHIKNKSELKWLLNRYGILNN